MVSRKRSKSGKKGWRTRRWNAVKDAISERSFDVWEKIPKKDRDAVLTIRQGVLGKHTTNGKDTASKEIIENKIEAMGIKMDYFFTLMKETFQLENHEIKSILFSPLPRKGRT